MCKRYSSKFLQPCRMKHHAPQTAIISPLDNVKHLYSSLKTICGVRSCILQGYQYESDRNPRQNQTALKERFFSARVPVTISTKIFFIMPYYQTTGLSYCPPPACTGQTILTGQGISKPLMVDKRHDTDSRRRQLTRLPRPCPQYPPFTLRYGNPFWSSLPAAHGVPALPVPATAPSDCRSCL